MPTITIHKGGQSFTAQVKEGSNLVVRAGIKQFPYPHLKYQCGMGNCGTCASRILKGAEHLPEPNWKERKLLGDAIEAGYRLCCQLWIHEDLELTQDGVVLPGKISVTLVTAGGKVIAGPRDSNLLRLSIREKGGIPFKCGGGICGTCRCRIEKGLENTDAVKDKERKHLTAAELAAGYRMACQTFLKGDVSVSWIPLKDRALSADSAAAGPSDRPAD
jgi:ferredoxin